MHDPGILTNYDDLGLDIEFDLDYSQTYNDADFYDEEAVRDEIELYSEAELNSVQSLEQEAVKKTHDLNILLSLLNESKTIIDKLKYDTDLDQKEVINFESEYQYSEEELSDLFDSKYFQNLITSFI